MIPGAMIQRVEFGDNFFFIWIESDYRDSTSLALDNHVFTNAKNLAMAVIASTPR